MPRHCFTGRLPGIAIAYSSTTQCETRVLEYGWACGSVSCPACLAWLWVVFVSGRTSVAMTAEVYIDFYTRVSAAYTCTRVCTYRDSQDMYCSRVPCVLHTLIAILVEHPSSVDGVLPAWCTAHARIPWYCNTDDTTGILVLVCRAVHERVFALANNIDTGMAYCNNIAILKYGHIAILKYQRIYLYLFNTQYMYTCTYGHIAIWHILSKVLISITRVY